MRKILPIALFLLIASKIIGAPVSDFAAMPPEIIDLVFSKLKDPKDLTNLSMVSTNFRELGYGVKNKHPESFKLSKNSLQSWFPGQISHEVLKSLSNEQIIDLGFLNPRIISRATRSFLKSAFYESKHELDITKPKAIYIFIFEEIWNQLNTLVMIQVRCQLTQQCWNPLEEQAMDQIKAQVGMKVRNQFWNHCEGLFRNHVSAHFRNPYCNPFEAETEIQATIRVRNQVKNQVRNQVKNQVRNQVWDQVGDQVRAHVKALLPCYHDPGSSEEERNNFINGLIPLVDRCISIYQFLFLKRIFNPSQDESKLREDGSKMTILEAIIDEIKNLDLLKEINIDAIYERIDAIKYDSADENIKNFIYPNQTLIAP